ncbi:hypothetical protein LXA43DRAFT_604924 [Ganoderma leucocontextum]|nr:hypothetical protein LXA43DRAFT_604924 [Ganoderma leucocontextum]
MSGVSQPGVGAWYLAILAAQNADDRERLLSKLCYIDYTKSNVNVVHVPEHLQVSRPGASWGRDTFIFAVSLDDLVRAKTTQLETRTVYLPHPKPSAVERRLADSHPPLKLSLCTWARAALRPYGCTMSDICPTEHDPGTYSLTLLSASFSIHIQYRHMLVHRNWLPNAIVIEARIWILSSDSDEHVRSDIVQGTPPYTSAVWTDEEPCAMTLPLRSVDLLTDSGDEVTLQLGLGLIAPSHYNVRVEVTTTNVATRATPELSTRAVSKRLHMVMEGPHADVKLTMLGSVRRAREYAVDLEGPEPDLGCSYSCSLRLITSTADPGFAVFIKYFHTLTSRAMDDTQELVVAARVTLESSSVPSNSLSETLWQDGPYIVAWRDRTPTWLWSHEQMQVGLTTPAGESLILHLGLDLAWQSEYYLLVDIERNATPSFRNQPHDRYGDLPDDSLDGPCRSITLTLPGQVKRALQAHGYEVHFKGFNEDGHPYRPNRYLLTLSSASLTIEIEYTHNRSADPVSGEEGSTLRACVRVFSSRSRSSVETRILEWDPWDPTKPVWCWNLPRKDVEFRLATGQRLTLHLGFYLVWFPEYCLTVDVNLQSPQSRPRLMIKTLRRALVWSDLGLKRHLTTWWRRYRGAGADNQAE